MEYVIDYSPNLFPIYLCYPRVGANIIIRSLSRWEIAGRLKKFHVRYLAGLY